MSWPGPSRTAPTTRPGFLIIGRQSCARTGHDKTSVVFSTSHQPGSLYSALGALSAQDMNMTHILSRPMKDRPWEYVFFVDFLGHEEEPGPEAALDGLKSHVAFFKILGSYPVGKLDETP
jgi:chorismate mutase/prephenate dehydratase